MTRQIIIRDEDYALALDLAEKLGTPIDEIVAKALREMSRPTSVKRPLTPSQEAELADIRALVKEAQQHIVPGASSDHSYLYDANGLPV